MNSIPNPKEEPFNDAVAELQALKPFEREVAEDEVRQTLNDADKVEAEEKEEKE
jgi:hypothetical protein